VNAGQNTNEASVNAGTPPTRRNHEFCYSILTHQRTTVPMSMARNGVIKDLILQRAGSFQYVVVSRVRFSGQGRLVLVPISSIALTTAKGIASRDLSHAPVEKAPEFRKEDLKGSARGPSQCRVDLGLIIIPPAGHRASSQSPRRVPELSATGARTHTSPQARTKMRKPEVGQRLFGKDLVNAEVELAILADLLVDVSKKSPRWHGFGDSAIRGDNLWVQSGSWSRPRVQYESTRIANVLNGLSLRAGSLANLGNRNSS